MMKKVTKKITRDCQIWLKDLRQGLNSRNLVANAPQTGLQFGRPCLRPFLTPSNNNAG
ncbi:MAG: hypothetical protein AAFV97_03250 [Bacteroidota bacterium]